MSFKKKLFMLNKIYTDWKSPKQRYPLAVDLHSEHLEYYYFVFREERVAGGKDQALIKKFDENGIPINKTYIDVTDKEYVYFPISIGQMGLAVFHTYLESGSDADKERFLKFAEWFSGNARNDKDAGLCWITDVSLPQYRHFKPWASAFSQSRGISILLRAYQLTGDKKYAEQAEQGLLPFEAGVPEGGVTRFTRWGAFYEEYAAGTPTLVLNGMIFALCGIFDFVRVFKDHERANRLFDQGITTVKTILPEYDLGFWSRYNLCEAEWYPEIDPATLGYHRLHITQLEMLHRLTGDDVFKQYAEKFSEQDKLFNLIRSYLLKYKALKKIGRL